MTHTVEIEINGQRMSHRDRQGRPSRPTALSSSGAVATMVLATVVAAKSAEGVAGLLPLTVEYRERAYAGGRIPGGYFKREGRPSRRRR